MRSTLPNVTLCVEEEKDNPSERTIKDRDARWVNTYRVNPPG